MIRGLLLLLTLLALPAAAQQNADIDAAARSVVRVVVVDQSGAEDAGVGMGSGVAITPTRIVTNAHVVESAVERGGFVGVIPSEGNQRYEGQVVAYNPAIDLAIIALKTGRIEPATLYGGVVGDGVPVAALGYPYGVDRAMASGVDDVIRPQSPVKSLGHVGGRRQNARFDAVLHDANIGRGNSGGPLIDACGRVIGINSFLSISDGIDSPFAFALSVRELVPFLKKAGVAATVVATPCLSNDEAAARDASLTQAERDAAAIDARRAAGTSEHVAAEKQAIRDEISGERDNAMALAAALLVGGALIGGAGIALLAANRRRPAAAAGALGVVLVVGAVVVFLGRPKLSEAEDRYARSHPIATLPVAVATTGAKLCTFVPERSIVKLSKPEAVPLDWRDDGCVNGRTQYGAESGIWTRTFVPNGEATVTIQSYDPGKARYTVERYLMGADAMTAARKIRSGYKGSACTADPLARRSVADMERAIRTVLPPQPNERLVYACAPAAQS